MRERDSSKKSRKKSALTLILDLEALHLLPIINEGEGDLKTLLSAFLGATLSHSVLSSFFTRLTSRVERTWLGRINRYMMPRKPSREPNSRDSASQKHVPLVLTRRITSEKDETNEHNTNKCFFQTQGLIKLIALPLCNCTVLQQHVR